MQSQEDQRFQGLRESEQRTFHCHGTGPLPSLAPSHPLEAMEAAQSGTHRVNQTTHRTYAGHPSDPIRCRQTSTPAEGSQGEKGHL